MTKYLEQQIDYLPWRKKTESEKAAQEKWQQDLKKIFPCEFGKEVFISPLAHIYGMKEFMIGENSFIAADVLIREAELTMGKDSSINSGCFLQGPIKIGAGVRIGPKASIIAMNHGFSDVSVPMYQQKIVTKGITIADDVWIGAGAIILDGIEIACGAVIGAGAVVTKNVAAYDIVAGNPAKIVRNRKIHAKKSRNTELTSKLERFETKVRAQLFRIREYYTDKTNDRTIIVDQPGMSSGIRPFCDLVELFGLFFSDVDNYFSEDYFRKIQQFQKVSIDYDVLTVGYALEVSQRKLLRSFAVEQEVGENLLEYLKGLPWQENPWGAGAAVDHLGTALYFNNKYFENQNQLISTLFGWLFSAQNQDTGLWGSGDNGDLHLPVNGFYRLTRGTYLTFDHEIPNCEKAVDSLLRQAKNRKYFGENRGNACDVLDIIQPLWSCKKQTNYRYHEGTEWAYGQIERILNNWHDNRGFSFELEQNNVPTLQGTEMGLAILFYLCDYVGLRQAINFEPKGVHRI